MNRLWLREYEILLSSNRRDDRKSDAIPCRVYDRPQTAGATTGRNNQEIKKHKMKKKVKNKNEDQLATEILAISMKGEFSRHAAELNERKYGMQRRYSSQAKSKSPFRPLRTFDEFQSLEQKRDLLFQTGDERIFHEIYPPVDPTKFQPMNQLSRPEKEGKREDMRRKSSPSRFHGSSIVNALLRSSEEFEVTPQDLQIAVAPVEKEIAQQAEGMWEEMISEIWSSGQCILYGDLTAFAASWQRTPTSRHVVRYLCALFGLKTHTSHLLVLGAERSLFRELLPLLKYLREVNPLTVPRKRLLKARIIYEKYFVPLKEEHSLQVTDSESHFHISALEQKLLRWVQAFQQVLAIILHAAIHQTLLENDAIDYAEETLQSLRRKEQQQQHTAHPTEASLAAIRYSEIKKKRIPHTQPPAAQLTEGSLSSCPSLAIISLTGVLPMDEMIPPNEERGQAQGQGQTLRMRSIEEEMSARGDTSSPLLDPSHRSEREREREEQEQESVRGKGREQELQQGGGGQEAALQLMGTDITAGEG